MKSLSFLAPLLLISALNLNVYGQYTSVNGDQGSSDADNTIEAMNSLLLANRALTEETLDYFDKYWKEGYLPMLLDLIYIAGDRVDLKAIVKLIEKKTNKDFGSDVSQWLDWIWKKDQAILPYHGDWMANWYENLDPRFGKYFHDRTKQSLIRLDEVRWGGVLQDGIPPLRSPKMIDASNASYLKDEHVVFGISINGDHRAYPKRILAWHEMFTDEIGGESIAGVYCTLCGTVIAYNTMANSIHYELGTSGFLYRSNKLMYDLTTQSLWNTIEGRPVIGPLIEEDIRLKSHSVVTTTWGEWRKRHPGSKVLSLDTGHRRNYNEGVAYERYFSSDELMFGVPLLDNRLRNKDEVLIVRAEGFEEDPLAISTEYLAKHKIFHETIATTKFVVFTDSTGANRVYESKDYHFLSLNEGRAKDEQGQVWSIREDRLIAESGEELNRLPYHRIFWFAWINSYLNTRLVH